MSDKFVLTLSTNPTKPILKPN